MLISHVAIIADSALCLNAILGAIGGNLGGNGFYTRNKFHISVHPHIIFYISQ